MLKWAWDDGVRLNDEQSKLNDLGSQSYYGPSDLLLRPHQSREIGSLVLVTLPQPEGSGSYTELPKIRVRRQVNDFMIMLMLKR